MHETIMAFDFGRRRIGVAVGQQVTGSANPLGVIRNNESGPDWPAIDKILNEWQPARLIVGMPAHVDGARSDISNEVDRFAAELKRFERPIETIDERYTSIEAGEILKSERAMGLRGRIRKEMIDSTAAVLIAERWLRKAASG
jgi:putative Holliday junction resolvase